jgi:UDP-4-amino-4,6-dideoxy-N-acetyl-beta-L-altrosamine transaminase
MIPYGRQDISADDIKAVVDVLKSDYLTQGPMVPAFERAVASYCGANHGVAVNSATSALHIACMALGIREGDIVWTTPITFVATSNCVLYCSAVIDFVDIDPETYNISVSALEEKLICAERNGKLPKLLIPVHLAGQPCDMAKISELGRRYGFRIIEDASHAIGARYLGEPVGNCRYSDITIFSFHPVKIITTCEGGMAVTNDQSLAIKMARLRSHGITRMQQEMTQLSEGPWYYQQIELGFNYRITDIQAALGISQLKRLDEFVAKRHERASRYAELLQNAPYKIPKQSQDTFSAFHLYILRLKKGESGFSQKELFERMRSHDILVNLHYIPVYRHPHYQKMGFDPLDYPEAELYYSEAISIPLYPSLTEAEQSEIVLRLQMPFGVKEPHGYQTLF